MAPEREDGLLHDDVLSAGGDGAAWQSRLRSSVLARSCDPLCQAATASGECMLELRSCLRRDSSLVRFRGLVRAMERDLLDGSHGTQGKRAQT
ncbi:MAG: hypothetical protein JWO86_2323 [Myxococcaceae bacterium]|nr:hypothetical protein [Myxococcaceae bacterium]